jgi:hypothetical protein
MGRNVVVETRSPQFIGPPPIRPRARHRIVHTAAASYENELREPTGKVEKSTRRMKS